MIHPQLRLGIPCYDLSFIAKLGLSRHIGMIHPLPTLLPWRAVCTRPENVFTAACWSAITTDSSFMESGCRLQSELRRNFRDLLAVADLLLFVIRHCRVCVTQGIRDVLTWRLPLLPSRYDRDRLKWIFNISRGLRSFPHLREHLTTRADDSHASPVLPSLRIYQCFQRYKTVACQALVRCFALSRIKPHAPPVVRVPVNSFEF